MMVMSRVAAKSDLNNVPDPKEGDIVVVCYDEDEIKISDTISAICARDHVPYVYTNNTWCDMEVLHMNALHKLNDAKK